MGDEGSPVLHLRIKERPNNRDDEEKLLQEIVDLVCCFIHDKASKDGILLTRAKYVTGQEVSVPVPSIRISICASISKKDIEKAAFVIRDSCKRILKQNTPKFI